MLITVEYEHLTKKEFLDKLTTRFVSYYPKVLFPDGASAGMILSILDSSHSIVRKISERLNNLIISRTSFWGYGINTISVGGDKISNWDIYEIPYAEPLNRHHNPDCHTFSLIIFTIEGHCLHYNLFHIDLVRNKLNSNEGLVDLRKHVMTIIKTRHNNNQMPEKIFVESIFEGLSNPLSFQIDSLFSQNYALNTAEYYKREITRLVQESTMTMAEKPTEQIHISGSGNNVVMGHNNVLSNHGHNLTLVIEKKEDSSNRKGFIKSITEHPIWSAVIATAITSIVAIFLEMEDVVLFFNKVLYFFKK